MTPAPDSMVERVARAWFSVEPLGTSSSEIWAIPPTRRISDAAWANMPGHNKANILRCARAAIEAMREPTDAMVEGGIEKTWEPSSDRPYIGFYDMKAAWQAAIDAALS